MLKGTNNEQKIWNYLSSKGLNDFAVAGLMGNLYAESGLRPNNLQNTYEKKLGMSDDEYTSAVDNGSYTNFIKDSAGYGLAQWTYWSRKQNLHNFAKDARKSIGDLEMQLDFLWKELQGYTGLMSILKTATSVLSASTAVLTQYERPANQGESVQQTRCSYGQNYYNKYATKIEPKKEETKMSFIPRLTKPEAGNPYYNTVGNGGYSHAIKGSPKDKGCDVLSNCVGYAYGRFNEIGGYGSCKYLSPTNAENFIQYKGSLEVGQTPKLGAVIVWQKGATLSGSDGAGHVAIVEKIISATQIVTSESGWGSSTPFWTKTRNKGSDGNWGAGAGYKFLGFIYNPAPCCQGTPTYESEKPVNTSGNIKVGDIVEFTGNTHYANAGAEKGSSCKPGKAKVTATYNGKHPYHLIAENGGGSNVYGWVNASDIKGTAQTAAEPKHETKPATANETVYTVVGGDTLSKIAAKYGTTYQKLAEYNGIKNPNVISIGQKIKIPCNTASVAQPKPAAPWTPKVGDIVNYNGSVHYSSANATSGPACKGGKAKIAAIYQLGKSKHPYHLVRVSGGGATVYGWVDAGTFTKA